MDDASLNDLTTSELKDRLVRSDARDSMLSERLSTCEARLSELQAFKQNHEKAWGALTPDEVVLFAKYERALLAQNPGGFLSKYHDALFCRSAVEAAKAETDALLSRAELAEAEASRAASELATAQRLVEELTEQMRIRCESVVVDNALVADSQDGVQRCDVALRLVVEEHHALKLRVRALEEERANDPGWARLTAEYEARLQAVGVEAAERYMGEGDRAMLEVDALIGALRLEKKRSL